MSLAWTGMPTNFYPRSPRGERPVVTICFAPFCYISIHAPREGSDKAGVWTKMVTDVFLSTLPARGATRSCSAHPHPMCYFYPRSPRGERLVLLGLLYFDKLFLSTLPARGATPPSPRICRASTFLSTLPARGATWMAASASPASSPFLSTLPARGATGVRDMVRPPGIISIHAPREGSDQFLAAADADTDNFYPRSPRGERQGQQRPE